jgi:hypothetical protein
VVNIIIWIRDMRRYIALLDLSPLSVVYVLVVHLLILIMNVLNNCCMLLIIMFDV